MKHLAKRIDALEGLAPTKPWHWIVCEPGESRDAARSRYEVDHGPVGDEPVIMWIVTGVPRSEAMQ